MLLLSSAITSHYVRGLSVLICISRMFRQSSCINYDYDRETTSFSGWASSLNTSMHSRTLINAQPVLSLIHYIKWNELIKSRNWATVNAAAVRKHCVLSAELSQVHICGFGSAPADRNLAHAQITRATINDPQADSLEFLYAWKSWS
jgi:hypothetical protein